MDSITSNIICQDASDAAAALLQLYEEALAKDSVVITNNAREFHRVPGLAVEEWVL